MIKLGVHSIWGSNSPISLDDEHLARHVYLVGKTGSGKTTLLSNILVQKIVAGAGMCVIDPHGDFAKTILDFIPPERIDDTVYIDAADSEYPISFNPLANVAPSQRPVVASGIVSAFKGVWGDSWGPRMEYILHNSILSLLCCQNVSLLGLNRLLIDPAYRQWVVRQIDDPLLVKFWIQEYEAYEPRFQKEAIAPIQNKIGQFFNNFLSRNILGQVRNRIVPRQLMDEGKIVVINLSKGKLGESCSRLLGSLIAQSFQVAAMTRSDLAEVERRPFILAIDEFQNFTSDTFISMLSESRKYGLQLILSHQYLDQLPENIRCAVLGNVGTIVAFTLGSADAHLLALEYGDNHSKDHFVDLNQYEALCKTQKGRSLSSILRVQTLPSAGIRYKAANKIRKHSREVYAQRRVKYEGKLSRWLNN